MFYTVAADSGTITLDLSYHPHVEAKTITTAAEQSMAKLDERQHPASLLLLDVSNTCLGDDGLRELSQRILLLDAAVAADRHDNNTVATVMELKAQMNRLTGTGATDFFRTLLRNTTSTTPAIRKLDFGWNRLYNDDGDHKANKAFYKSLQDLLASKTRCPETLCLERTGLGPAACRAIGKGMMARFDHEEEEGPRSSDDDDGSSNNTKTQAARLLSLHLAGNPIGDAGAAALAAAIRTVCSRTEENGGSSSDDGTDDGLVLDTLDLSACDIGDAGAEALALALEDGNRCPVRRLVLCNNRISDQGALSLGRSYQGSEDLHLLLDNNSQITDRGIATIVDAVEKGQLADVSLRSCSIHADGAELWGKALRNFAERSNKQQSIHIDLSGNPLGVLRGKSKTEGSKYSASRLKSQASATASAYMNHGLNFLKKGIGPAFAASSGAESDDEEEKLEGSASASAENTDDPSNKRCGFKAMANAFIGEEHPGDHHAPGTKISNAPRKRIRLGLRRTFCDTAGADALAAMLVASRDDLNGVELELELDLNPIVEDEAIAALHGEDEYRLREMAERHAEAMEIIRVAQERAAEASRMAAARREAAGAAYDRQRWDAPPDPYDVDLNDEEEHLYEDEWDSDAVYEDEDDEEY